MCVPVSCKPQNRQDGALQPNAGLLEKPERLDFVGSRAAWLDKSQQLTLANSGGKVQSPSSGSRKTSRIETRVRLLSEQRHTLFMVPLLFSPQVSKSFLGCREFFSWPHELPKATSFWITFLFRPRFVSCFCWLSPTHLVIIGKHEDERPSAVRSILLGGGFYHHSLHGDPMFTATLGRASG